MTNQHNPAHPGDVLKDGVFTDTDITVTAFAQHIGVTRAALSRLLNKQTGVSPEMALKLAGALGGSAEKWLHMQANYDLWKARKKVRKPIGRFKAAA